jgi:flavin reductase (DIM6/NTAB) family NADH-FMN oxidoreductase RutF
MIEECPVNIECVTRHHLGLGAHDLFIGEILAVHFDDDVLDSRGRLQPAKVDALAYVHGDYWSLGEKVGSYGFTLKESQGEAQR